MQHRQKFYILFFNYNQCLALLSRIHTCCDSGNMKPEPVKCYLIEDETCGDRTDSAASSRPTSRAGSQASPNPACRHDESEYVEMGKRQVLSGE